MAGKINTFLFRPVGNTDAAADIDKFKPDVERMRNLNNQLEKNFGGFHKILGVQFVGGHHRMNTETLDAFIPADSIAFKQLFPCKTVFGFFRMADDHIAFFQRAGIIAKTDQVQASRRFFPDSQYG